MSKTFKDENLPISLSKLPVKPLFAGGFMIRVRCKRIKKGYTRQNFKKNA